MTRSRGVTLEDTMDAAEQLQLAFFTKFSTFEHHLKEHGYLQSRREALPDRKTFQKDATPHLALSAPLSEALRYFKNKQPMIQLVVANRPQFEDERLDDGEAAPFLVECVYRVRNNLFHGGKIPFAPERDGDLLRHSLVVLEELERILAVLPCRP